MTQEPDRETGPAPLRVLVIGTSGSGKSTFAQRLAASTAITWHELDLINWRPGWHDRHLAEPDAFLADVAAAAAGDNWVMSGGYSMTRPVILPRLTHIVWLDLPHWQVMAQVIGRSLRRAASGSDVFPGCREDWPRLFTAEHPIRYAWSTHHAKRPRFAAQVDAVVAAGGKGHHCTSRAASETVLAALSRHR